MSIDFIKSIYFELVSYFIPQKIKYKIEGHCIKCGKCCKEIRAYGLKNEMELKFMQFIFPHYRYFYISYIDKNNKIVLSCKNLNTDNTCSIYKFRPFLCRNYPKKYIFSNIEMIDNCGYKVIKKHFKDYL